MSRQARFPMIRTMLVIGLAVAASFGFAARHPANIPVARAKVQVDGSVELKVRFDILAFVVDQTPTDVLDAPMNALIDGPEIEMQRQLDLAERRFKRSLRLTGNGAEGTFGSFTFPTAKAIHDQIAAGPETRLPVMVTLTIPGHLPAGASSVSLQFPEIMGEVVLTTEFPYLEPVSEAVEPGSASTVLHVPSQKEVDAAAARIEQNVEIRNSSPAATPILSEDQARNEIKVQYDAWSAAYMKNDVDKLLSILDPGYTLKAANGQVITHSEYAVMLNLRKKKGPDTTRHSTQILRLTLHDGVAAIFARETTTSKRFNPNTKKEQTVDSQHDYVDAWVYSHGKWLLRSTVTQRETTQIRK